MAKKEDKEYTTDTVNELKEGKRTRKKLNDKNEGTRKRKKE
jgi:hypothetical protein